MEGLWTSLPNFETGKSKSKMVRKLDGFLVLGNDWRILNYVGAFSLDDLSKHPNQWKPTTSNLLKGFPEYKGSFKFCIPLASKGIRPANLVLVFVTQSKMPTKNISINALKNLRDLIFMHIDIRNDGLPKSSESRKYRKTSFKNDPILISKRSDFEELANTFNTESLKNDEDIIQKAEFILGTPNFDIYFCYYNVGQDICLDIPEDSIERIFTGSKTENIQDACFHFAFDWESNSDDFTTYFDSNKILEKIQDKLELNGKINKYPIGLLPMDISFNFQLSTQFKKKKSNIAEPLISDISVYKRICEKLKHVKVFNFKDHGYEIAQYFDKIIKGYIDNLLKYNKNSSFELKDLSKTKLSTCLRTLLEDEDPADMDFLFEQIKRNFTYDYSTLRLEFVVRATKENITNHKFVHELMSHELSSLKSWLNLNQIIFDDTDKMDKEIRTLSKETLSTHYEKLWTTIENTLKESIQKSKSINEQRAHFFESNFQTWDLKSYVDTFTVGILASYLVYGQDAKFNTKYKEEMADIISHIFSHDTPVCANEIPHPFKTKYFDMNFLGKYRFGKIDNESQKKLQSLELFKSHWTQISPYKELAIAKQSLEELNKGFNQDTLYRFATSYIQLLVADPPSNQSEIVLTEYFTPIEFLKKLDDNIQCSKYPVVKIIYTFAKKKIPEEKKNEWSREFYRAIQNFSMQNTLQFSIHYETQNNSDSNKEENSNEANQGTSKKPLKAIKAKKDKCYMGIIVPTEGNKKNLIKKWLNLANFKNNDPEEILVQIYKTQAIHEVLAPFLRLICLNNFSNEEKLKNDVKKDIEIQREKVKIWAESNKLILKKNNMKFIAEKCKITFV